MARTKLGVTKAESAPQRLGIRLFLLTVSLVGLPVPSSASTGLVADPPADQSVLVPAQFGGMTMASSWAAEPVQVYRMVEAADSLSAPGIDPIQTSPIIPGVFGSVALPIHNFSIAARWVPIYKAIVDCTPGSACDRQNAAFGKIIDIARHKNFHEKLAFVNSSINRLITYKSDMAVYGVLDHWAVPSEILEHRVGDCEDFAILKMTALVRADIPAQSMSLVVLQDRRRKFFHAVLSVSTTSGAFILDSLSNAVVRDRDLPDYVPLYSLSTDRAWIHGSKSDTKVAELADGLASVAPGEGCQAK